MTAPPADPATRLDVRLVPAALTGWAVTAAGIVWPVGAYAAAGGAVLAAVAAIAARRAAVPRHRLIAMNLLAAAVIGAGFGVAVALRSAAVAANPVRAAVGRTTEVDVTPAESPVPTGARRLMFRASLTRLGDAPAAGRVVVFAPGGDFTGLVVGQPLRFRARIGAPIRHDLTVAVLTAAGSPTRGAVGPVDAAAHRVRSRFAAAAARVLPGEQARLLPALVLGDTTAITADTGREFRVAGLTHLMAVSGANVTIVCGAVLLATRLIGPRPAALLAGVTLVGFVIVVQPSASVLRAAVMGAIALLGVLTARRRQAIPSLAGTVLLLLVSAPQLAVDVGFALSVVATAALVVIAPVWSARLVGRGWPKPLADAVCVAWAAHLVTAPLIAAFSGQLSLISAAANLVVAAVIAPITILGSAAAVLGGWWPGAAELLIRFTGPELWWVCRVAHLAGVVPGAAVPVPDGPVGLLGVGAAAVLVGAGWRCRWVRLAAAAVALGVLAWSLSVLLTGRAEASTDRIGPPTGRAEPMSGERDTIVGWANRFPRCT